MSDDPIIVEFDAGVARLTLNRPDAANAIDLGLAESMLAAVAECEGRQGLRVVLVRGAGDLFCGGGDLKALASANDLPAFLRELTTAWHAALVRLVGLDVPVVMSVHGPAAGAGLGLVGAGDIVLAGARARFSYAYANIGLGPDGGTSYFLTRTVGLRRATELALTGRTLSAAEAQEWGLVTTVIDDDELEQAAAELASLFAAGPTNAFAAAKRLLYDGQFRSLESQLEAESRAIAATGATDDARRAIASRLAGERPTFTGT